MGAIDRWWNARFPAHSVARLVFLMLAAPIVSVLVAIVRDLAGAGDFTAARYLMTTLGVEVLLCFSWAVARVRPEALYDGPDSDGAEQGSTWRGPRVPWEISRAPEQKRPPEWNGASVVLDPPARPRISRLNDFTITLGISLVTMTLLNLFFWGAGMPAMWDIGTAAVGGLLMALAITFRYSIWMIVALSIAIAFPAAAILHVFFFFLGGEDHLVLYWAICAVGVFAFFLPPWMRMRQFRGRWERMRIPNWVLTSVVSVLMLMGAAMATMETPVSIAAGAHDRSPDLGNTASAGKDLGTTSRDAASLQLFFAWKDGDRGRAGQVAVPQAVSDLFSHEFRAGDRYLGCGMDEVGREACLIRTSSENIVLGTEGNGGGRFYVAFVRRQALDYRLTYPAATPTPSISAASTP